MLLNIIQYSGFYFVMVRIEIYEIISIILTDKINSISQKFKYTKNCRSVYCNFLIYLDKQLPCK